MDEHQACGGAGQAHLAEGERRGQQHGLERQEAAEQQQTEEQLRATEAPERQHITVQCADGGGNEHGGNGDLDRVPEVTIDGVPGLDPANAGDHGGPAQQVAVGDVFRGLEAGEQHHHQRHQIQQHRKDQHRVDRNAAQADGRFVSETSHYAWSSARSRGKAR